jgi:16S rRNA (guanine1207-N2)-methyltransferase
MTEHYFSPRPESALTLHDIAVRELGQDIVIKGASGLFSAKETDKGTLLLIRKAQVNKGSRVLDLGCGNGIVGLMMAKAYAADVVMSDINERAVFIAKMNVRALDLDIPVKRSDGFANVEGAFDVILLNPPQTAGRAVCERLIEESKEHLVHGGSLQIVARHNKGGEQLSLFMEKVFGNVKDIGKKGGFRVYLSVN